MTKQRVGAGLTVMAGLVLGIFALLSVLQHGGRASAAPAATCSVSGGVATVSLVSGTPNLTVNASHDLVVDNTGSCGVLPGGVLPNITSISIVITSGDSPTGVLLDQSSGRAFPSGAPIDARSLGSLSVEVDGGPSQNLIAGVNSTGVNQVNTGSYPAPNVTISSTAALILKGGTGPVTLSAGGPTVAGFGSGGSPGPSTVTVTLDGTASGGANPDTFVAGNGPETFSTASAGSTLDFSLAFIGTSGNLTVNSSTVSTSGLNQYMAAVTNGGASPLATYNYATGGADFTTIKGLSSGPTSFYADTSPAGYSLVGNNVTVHGPTAGNYALTIAGFSSPTGTGNQVVAGPGTESFAVTGTALTLTSGPDADTFTVTPPTGLPAGVPTGNNTFVAGPGTDVFYASGTGNTVDFSNVLTSPSAQLAINAAGAPQTVGPAGNTVTLKNGQAAVGSTVSYTFLRAAGSTDASTFTTFLGPKNGNTQFLAGGSGGLTFNGNGTANSASFLGSSSSPSGVVVNLSGGSQTTSAALSASGALNGFTLGSGQVVVAPPTSGSTSCSGSPLPLFCDSILNVATVTGPATGYSTFYAGAAPTSFTFSDAGDHNTFLGGSGTDNFSSAGNFNTFVAGSGSATFSESTSQQGASNTIDFSSVPVGSSAGCPGPPCSLTVNVSGSPAAVSNYQAAVLTNAQQPVATYSFGNGGPDFTNFVGATGGNTTFDGGLGSYTYTGKGAGNTLDFSDVSSTIASSLVFDVTHSPTPQATLAQVPETFSGITNLIGLASGNTQFQGGSTGGYTFKGNGSGNQATFTAQGPSTTLTVSVNSDPLGSAVTGGTVSFTLPGGTALCTPVPVIVNNETATASCSTAKLPAGTNVIATYTPPAGSSFSGSGYVLTQTGGSPTFVTTITAPTVVPPATTAQEVQGQPVQFQAKVDSASAVPSGTVSFSVAGGSSLCSGTVTGGSTEATVSCIAPFSSAGTFDVLAVYTPSDTTITGSAAPPLRVTVNPPAIQTTTTDPSAGSCFFFSGPICDPSAVVTNTASSGNSGLPDGTVTFSQPGGGPFCSAPVTATSASSVTATCPSYYSFNDGSQIVAVFTPKASPSSVTPSAGITTVESAPSPPSSTTTLTSSTATPSQGSRFTLTSVVSVGSGTLPGGTVSFDVAGGTNLCSVPVPSGSGSATLQCSASFSSVGSQDIIATYSPSGGSVYGSASHRTLQVQALTATTSSVTTNQDLNAGVVVNLSASPTTSSTGVSVGGGQVLVAAPPSAGGSYSCSGSPLPSFCDSLINITVVNGSMLGHNTFIAGSGSETFGDTGTVGGDAVDFSHVATSSTAPLTVNVSGAPVNGVSNYTATVGSATYNFSQGGANFTTFAGSANGNTSFVAGSTPGYSFTGAGASNSVDFSAVSCGLAIDLSATPGAGTVTFPGVLPCTAGIDTLVGLTTVTGSSGGNNRFTAGGTAASYNFTGNGNNNTFTGGAGSDQFSSNGNNNDFVLGTGSATLTDPGFNNKLDFSKIGARSLTVDVAGVQVGGPTNDTASAGGSVYTFTSFGNSPTTIVGSTGGTTFYAGTAADTFVGQGLTADTLSFAFAPSNGPLTINTVGVSCAAPGQVVVGSVQEQFCAIKTFDGLAGGNTTFVTDSTPGYTFAATGANNTADFSAATSGITADLSLGNVQVASGTCPASCDTISGVSSVLGAHNANNTFIAGNGSETFAHTGTGNDTLNFSHVATSSTAPLTVNVSGAPVNGVSNYTATVGSATYNFSQGGANFTTFAGSANGNTSFVAGSTPGYSFTGAGASNSVDFSAVSCGLAIDLSATPGAGTVTFPGVLPCTAGIDTLVGLTTVTGSSGGNNRFTAGGTAASYNFTGNGNNNTFTGGAGSDQFSSNGNNNDFVLGTGSATLTDPGFNNKLDFSKIGARSLTVDVAGVQVGGPTNDTASAGGSVYTFTSFSNSPTTIVGSTGGTTFYAGTAADTFVGQGLTADTLSFAFAPSNGPLTINTVGVSCAAPGQVVVGSVQEQFCAIKTFDGLAGGNTTFVTDSTPGYTFAATGANNTADFSAATSGITADLSLGNVQVASGTCPASCDTISGVSSVLGAHNANNTFIAGNGSETFAHTGTGNDTLNFSHVATSASTLLTVNVSGTPVTGIGNFSAGVGSSTYTFSNGGASFTNFIGSTNGFTKFVAAGATGNYRFCATAGAAPGCGSVISPPPGDTVDFSANLSGITANLSPSTEPAGGLTPGQVSVASTEIPDTVGGMSTVIGSPSGSNVFFGGMLGTNFTAGSTTNTLSYVGETATPVTVNLSTDRVSAPGKPTDTFTFAPGTFTVQGSPGKDTFILGTSAVSLQGGGGSDTLDLSQVPASSGTTGATVNLATGSVSNPSVTFTPGSNGCTDPTQLCVGSVIGSTHDDTFVANSNSLAAGAALSIKGNGGNDTLDLSNIPASVTATMPTTSLPTGTVKGSTTGSITFTGVPNVVGTQSGGDTFTVGSGTESFTENGSTPGILDFSKVGNTNAGVTVSVGNVGGVSSGSVTSTPSVGVADTFTNIATFNGTAGPDTFAQSGPGAYTFNGGAGGNILDLTNAPSDVTVNLAPPSPACITAGTNNGTAKTSDGTTVNDTFTCMATVLTAGTQIYQASPGQTSMLNGGGNGTLRLVNDTGTGGATITLPNGSKNGTVTGDGYNFSFTGMATVIGTPNNDLFIPGTGNVQLIGGGGDDAISYNGISEPSPVVANLSNVAYTIPAGFPGAGTSAAAATATGGYGGTIALSSISNVIGTTRFNDILIAGPGPGTLVGGSGNDRFVLSGGDTFVAGGTGSGTALDMSQLPGQTQLNLGNSSPQNTGAGTVTIQPGTIHNVVASPGGSNLRAGNGNVTLQGGPGKDTLSGGNGTQTLIGGGGNDTLVAGVGNQTLQGGAQPVTFVPGQGNDTLTAQASGNLLDYSNAPNAAQVNLSSAIFPIPQTQGGGFISSLTATGGSGATVNLSQASITTVNGSSKTDIIVTGSSGDTVNGNGGDDLIVAEGGNNFLNACSMIAPNSCGSPKTTFAFDGAGNNVIKGGGVATVDFSQAPAGVTVDLQHGTASGGFGGFQSLTGVLNAVGTNSNDVLIAGAPGGTMTGLNGGADRLQSGPQGGDTLVSGGSASDTFCAESSCAVGGTAAGGGNTMTGGFGNDTFFSRNGVVDTIDGGGGFNSAQVDSFDTILNNSIQSFLP